MFKMIVQMLPVKNGQKEGNLGHTRGIGAPWAHLGPTRGDIRK